MPSASTAEGYQLISKAATGQPLLEGIHYQGTHLCDCAANEEAVIECVQLLTLWQLVTGANQAQEGHRQALVAIVKQAFVQQRQEGVQDGTAVTEQRSTEGTQ
jgi:hypothetical protein